MEVPGGGHRDEKNLLFNCDRGFSPIQKIRTIDENIFNSKNDFDRSTTIISIVI